jgi:glycosyltransferase involved in cell wall biosynthesis
METTRPKALYATYDHVPGPSGSACWSGEIIRHLARHFEVDGLSLKDEDLSHIERFHGARLLRVPVGTGSFRDRIKAYRRALHRQLGSEDYKLCHFTSIWEGLELCTAAKAQRYKLVYEVNRLPSIDFRLSNPDDAREVETSLSLKQQEERCFAMADLLVANSPLVQKHLERRGVPAEKIRVVTPAIDLAPFERPPPPGGGPGTILYLGSIKPWQGVELVLRALASFPRHIRARFLVVAPREQPWDRELKTLAHDLGLSKVVEFLDPVPFEDLPALVAQASICVAPLSNHERNRIAAPIPHKVLVYMAARRPVVAPQQPVFRDLIEPGVHGLLYPPNDVAGLADALVQLLLDRELGMRLGHQARAHLEEHFGLERSLARLGALWHEPLGLLAGVPAGPPGVDLFTGDTSPLSLGPQAEPPGPVPDTQPGLARPEDEPALEAAAEELVFRSVEGEPPSLAADGAEVDRWQVLEASQVRLNPRVKPGRQAADGAAVTDPARPRFLLGGPPFPVGPDGEPPGDEIQRSPTARDGRGLSSDAELPLLEDHEVKTLGSPGSDQDPEPA